VVLGTGVILFLLVLVALGLAVLHGELVNRRFLTLGRGIGADQVIAVMGAPKAVERCTGLETLLDRGETPCTEQYVYRSVLSRWIIGIDSNSKVAFLHQYVSE
jgi:hypothetical protein